MQRTYAPILATIAAVFGVTWAALAGVADRAPELAGDDLGARDRAQVALFREASEASRPGAEAERVALSEELCRALSQNPALPAALTLVRRLQQIGGAEAVDTLAGLMTHPDARLRDAARMALSVNPSSEASDALLAALDASTDRAFTIGLLNALGTRGEARAVAPISRYLSRPDLRDAAAAALSWIPDRSAVRSLLAARRETPTPALTHAVLELAATFRRADQPSMAARMYRRLLDAGEPEDVRTAALIGVLTLPGAPPGTAASYLVQPSERMLAAVTEAASQVESDALRVELAKQLPRISADRQLQILGVLEQAGGPGTEEWVAPLLASDDPVIADAAVAALAVVGTEHSVPALVNAGAVDALSRLHPMATSLLLEQYAAEGETGSRATAIRALAKRMGPDATPLLTGYARDADDAIAGTALQALEDVAPAEAMPTLAGLMVEAESADRARAALKTIVAVLRRAPDAVGALAEQLPNADPDARGRIYKALAEVGSDTALAPVAEAARAGSPEALRTLGSWPESNAVPVLLDLAQDEAIDLKNHVPVMRGLARLLGQADTVDLGACRQCLEAARRPDERRLILGVIGQSGDAAALALVEPYLTDPDVTAEATQAAEAIRKKADASAAH